jgi:phospholipid transport system substrate-binding protein
MDYNRVTKRLLVMGVMALTILGLGVIAQATTIPSPRDVVLDTSQRVLEALKNQQITVADDPEYFYGLADELIVPHFNFRRMSQRVLGKYWRQATDEQQVDFVNQFRQLLVRTYVTALYKYSAKDITNFLQERIKVLPTNYPPEATRVNVKVLVEGQNGGPPINMILNLYLNKEKTWKVDDIQVEGVSLVTNYRATFYREIRAGGIQGLIDKLVSRNQHAMTMK